jgi:hypothetical protein
MTSLFPAGTLIAAGVSGAIKVEPQAVSETKIEATAAMCVKRGVCFMVISKKKRKVHRLSEAMWVCDTKLYTLEETNRIQKISKRDELNCEIH